MGGGKPPAPAPRRVFPGGRLPHPQRERPSRHYEHPPPVPQLDVTKTFEEPVPKTPLGPKAARNADYCAKLLFGI
jgi:hypothetical protein